LEVTFENTKPSDGVIVNRFPWHFDEIGADTDYTRPLGTNRRMKETVA
jgi:hypothetical protein